MSGVTPPPEARLLEALARIAEATKDRQPSGLRHDDADDVEGTIASDDAIGFNPLPLLRRFAEYGVRVVIIGQVAGILHGSMELTGDLDLLWSGSESDGDLLAEAFNAMDAELWDDDGNTVAVSPDAFRLPKVEFRTTQAAGDCCTPALPWGALDVSGFLDRAESASVDGFVVHYVNRDDLVAMRVAVGREKDLRRAAELQALGPE